jgi:gamma-glutamyltranspeptidase/glutathione hydrolase
VDAAVAAALALGVVEPAASGLGGMAAMLVHRASKRSTVAITGPCLVPRPAVSSGTVDGRPRRGYTTIALPTNPAVLGHALRRFGTLNRPTVLAPAIGLADEGYAVTPLENRLAAAYIRSLQGGSACRFILGPDRAPLRPGEIRRQPELAWTLRRLAYSGFEDFYVGLVGSLVLKDMERNGGLLGPGDLEDIPWPLEERPLRGAFGGQVVLTAPFPDEGPALVGMLARWDEMSPFGIDPDSPEAAVLLARIIRRLASGDRDDGSHLCVMDRSGNVVSLTQSIGRPFGAASAAHELGFLYNNYVRTSRAAGRRRAASHGPWIPARCSAAPTILLGPGMQRLAVGSSASGGPSSAIFQVLVRLRTQDPFTAVMAPRLHCTPRGRIYVETDRFPPAALERLRRSGFTIRRRKPWSHRSGATNLALFDGETYRGIADPRRDGAAEGPRKKPELPRPESVASSF